MRAYYPGITIFKVVGSILVVLAHAVLMTRFTWELEAPAGIVVGCFWIVSGFLFRQKSATSPDARTYARHYVTRLGLIYVVFVLLYTARDFINDISVGGMARAITWWELKSFVIDLILGPSFWLWFIPPLLFGIIVTSWMLERGSFRMYVPVLIVGFILALCLNGVLTPLCALVPGYAVLIKNEWIIYGSRAFINYWGYGLTFVALGMLIADRVNGFISIKLIRLIAPFAAIGICELAFTYWKEVFPVDGLSLCSLLGSILLFRLVICRRTAYGDTQRFWNTFSWFAYFLHWPLLEMHLMGGEMKWPASLLADSLLCGVVLGECLACALVAVYWSRSQGAGAALDFRRRRGILPPAVRRPDAGRANSER